MLFTYGKGGTLQQSTYPINSRPATNVDPSLNDFRGPGHGKPNPMKHWRKQLQPYYHSNSTQITIDQIENPSVSILTNVVNDHVLTNQLLSTNDCIGIKTPEGCKGGSYNIRRSGSTIINPKYSTSTRQYLQKKCKSFEQNQKRGKKTNHTTSSYQYTNCFVNCSYLDNPLTPTIKHTTYVTHKASNPSFQTQGSVTAEGYIAKIKEQEIQKNNHDQTKSILKLKHSKKLEPECCKKTDHNLNLK